MKPFSKLLRAPLSCTYRRYTLGGTISTNVDVSSKPKTLKSFSEIPGPSKIINYFDFFRYSDRVSQLRHQWFEKYGDIVRFSMPGLSKCIALRDPKDIKLVYMSAGPYPERLKLEPFTKLHVELGRPQNIGDAEGEAWRRWRRVFHPLTQPDYVRQFVPRISQVATDWVAFVERKMKNGEIRASELTNVCSSFSFEAFSSIILGLRMGLLYDKEVHTVIKEFVQTSLEIFGMLHELVFGVNQMWRYMETPLWKKWKTTWEKIYSLGKIILNEKEKFDVINDGASNFEAWLKTQNLTQMEMESATIELVFGGVDTTENGLVWSLLRLAKEQEAQEKIHQEVRSIAPSGIIQPEQLAKMKYLSNCFKEIQRMDPFVGTGVRIMKNDAELRGYKIPAGTAVFLDIYSSAKCPHWVHQPEEFNPERHAKKQHDPFTQMTFGFGARQCAGKRMAEMEIQLALAHLLREYRMELEGEIPMKVEQLFLAPDYSQSNPVIKYEKRV